MRILYGVSGEGFGHSSRAKIIISHLIKEGHIVLVLTYGQAYQVLHDKFPTIKIEGFCIEFENNKLSIPKTLSKAQEVIGKNIVNWNSIKTAIDSFNPELCISDMEPLVPIISFWSSLPLISIDNQHRITHIPIKVPKEYLKDYLIAKATIHSFISKADAFIILSFTKSNSKSKNVFVVPPVLRDEVLALKPSKGSAFLVYLTKPNLELISILKKIPHKFTVYGYDKEVKEDNLQFKKTSPQFIGDLSKSKAIIASSGFSLMGEALYLKKPYFAIPLMGHFEQALNALFLKKAGYGDFCENPSLKQIESFISNLPNYEKALSKYKSNPNEVFKVLDKILKKF